MGTRVPEASLVALLGGLFLVTLPALAMMQGVAPELVILLVATGVVLLWSSTQIRR